MYPSDEQMDTAVQSGKDVAERSSDQLTGREEVMVTITKTASNGQGSKETFAAFTDDPDGMTDLRARVDEQLQTVLS